MFILRYAELHEAESEKHPESLPIPWLIPFKRFVFTFSLSFIRLKYLLSTYNITWLNSDEQKQILTPLIYILAKLDS